MTLPPAYGNGGAGIVTGFPFSATEQALTGVLWTDAKQVFRKVIDIGGLPNATTKNVAHGITGLDTVIEAEGIALNTSGGTHVQLGRPTAGAGSQVTINVNATNVQIVTDADLTANDDSHVILLYTKT